MLQSAGKLRKHMCQEAYVMINCEDGAQERILEELKSIEGIMCMTSVVGRYDIVTKIVTPSIEALQETIELRIRRIEKVCVTTTIICESSTSFLHFIKGSICHV